MALAAEHDGTSVQLVPIGLNFDRKAMFRSRVTVVFGAPFSGRDLLPTDDDSDAAAVRALTDRIAGHMRRLLVEADPRADAALVDRVDRLYAAARGRPADPADRLARRQTIAAGKAPPASSIAKMSPATYSTKPLFAAVTTGTPGGNPPPCGWTVSGLSSSIAIGQRLRPVRTARRSSGRPSTISPA